MGKTEKPVETDGPHARPPGRVEKLLALQRQKLSHPPVALGMAGSVYIIIIMMIVIIMIMMTVILIMMMIIIMIIII